MVCPPASCAPAALTAPCPLRRRRALAEEHPWAACVRANVALRPNLRAKFWRYMALHCPWRAVQPCPGVAAGAWHCLPAALPPPSLISASPHARACAAAASSGHLPQSPCDHWLLLGARPVPGMYQALLEEGHATRHAAQVAAADMRAIVAQRAKARDELDGGDMPGHVSFPRRSPARASSAARVGGQAADIAALYPPEWLTALEADVPRTFHPDSPTSDPVSASQVRPRVRARAPCGAHVTGARDKQWSPSLVSAASSADNVDAAREMLAALVSEALGHASGSRRDGTSPAVSATTGSACAALLVGALRLCKHPSPLPRPSLTGMRGCGKKRGRGGRLRRCRNHQRISK